MSGHEPPEIEEPFPVVFTREEVRFEVGFALHQVGKSTVWEWARTDRLKREAAKERIIDTVLARFDRLQVRGPASAVSMFQDRVLDRKDNDA